MRRGKKKKGEKKTRKQKEIKGMGMENSDKKAREEK